MDKIKAFFKIDERKSSIWAELIGGLVTFLAMVYILPVNAGILSDNTGMNFAAVFAATAIATAFATLLMGLYANYPVALAPGMGVNAFFTYTVIWQLNYSWEQALAAVFISGVLFVIISLTGVRRYIINAIPKNLKLAIGAGIGFFIAFIGLKNAGVIVANGSTFVALGDLSHPTVLLGLFGIILVFILYAMNKKISRFAVIISIVTIAVAGLLLGAIFPSLKDAMPAYNSGSLGSVKDIKYTIGKCFAAIPDLLANPMSYAVIFTFLFVDFFDTAGTLVAVGKDSGLMDENGQMQGDNNAFLADAVGTVAGSVLGTSTVTSYIESTTGIQSGARTGLSSVVVALLFIVSLLFYPLFSVAGSIEATPGVFYSPVTAMALVFVGAMMIGALKDIDWKDPVIVCCAFITIIMMLLAYSIAEGIAFGFIFYVLMMLASKRFKEISWPMYALALLFVINFVVKFTILQ